MENLRISDMPVYNGAKTGVYLPVVVNGGNRKYDLNSLASKTDISGIPGTVAELRAMSTTEGKVYFSTDFGGGTWVDLGLNDGRFVDDGGIYIITANAHALKRQFRGSIDITWYGANESRPDNDVVINSVIAAAKARRNAQGATLRGANIQVSIPAGKYKCAAPIQGAVGVDIVGQGKNDSALIWEDKNSGGIIFNEAGALGTPLEFIVTEVNDLSILGGAYLDNPFAFKDTTIQHPGSNGLEVYNLRLKLNRCSIEGWSDHGIITSSTYYINVDSCFIKNNKVGYHISQTSTSNFLTHSEVRLNGIGVIISTSSFGNFILNSTIESNFSNFLDNDNDILYSKGKAIILQSGATGNFILNNYIEAHIVTFALSNANNNLIANNILTPGIFGDTIFDLVTYYGQVSGNRYADNVIQFYTPETNVRIRVLNANWNYSSELYSFNQEIFGRIISANLSTFHSQFLGVEGNAPTLRDSVTNATYRGLVLRDPNTVISADDIASGEVNKFSQFLDAPGGVRLNGLLGIGKSPGANLDILVSANKRFLVFDLAGEVSVGAVTDDGLDLPLRLLTNYTKIGGKVGYITAPADFPDDAAAAAGGVDINQTYRTGNVLKIRLA